MINLDTYEGFTNYETGKGVVLKHTVNVGTNCPLIVMLNQLNSFISAGWQNVFMLYFNIFWKSLKYSLNDW